MTNHLSGQVASVVFAAGKGSRMQGYAGNKTLLPLLPVESIYRGTRPLLVEVLESLPPGPKAVVVHHCAADVEKATAGLAAAYPFQEVTNGTGGALLAARPFLESLSRDCVLITMGDVPLIRSATYRNLVAQLKWHELALLAFEPEDRAHYGMLETQGERIVRIVEWKYWSSFEPERMAHLRFCNAGVYAARRAVLLDYLARLANHPHSVRKQRGDDWVTIKEYFLTDLVELMSADGRSTGMLLAPEEEVMGVDTPEALQQVQRRYAARRNSL